MSRALGRIASAATPNLMGSATPGTCSSASATGTNTSIQCCNHFPAGIGDSGSEPLRVVGEITAQREIEIHALHPSLALHPQEIHSRRMKGELLLLDCAQVARPDAIARLR